MIHHIMKDYLRWFDQQMRIQGKHVLLLIDNFSAHELAIEQIKEMTTPLTNAKVTWLPPNATSVH